MTEHLKVSGTYWGLTALDLLDALSEIDKAEVIDFVLNCQHSNGLLPS